ncbi:hypothetical protein ACP4OV_002214 [Aristida adscensionis]
MAGERRHHTMEPAISCSLGAMGTVLAQVDELIKPGQSLPRGISKTELEDLAKDLNEISTAIMDLSNKEEEPSFTDKCWMNEVREICYDVEDYLMMHKALHSRGVLRGTKRRRLIAEDISELRASLLDARRRRQRSQLAELTRARLQQDDHQRRERCRPALAGFQTTVNSILQTPRAVLDQPMKELVDLLAFDGEPKLKVVSIFGFAGVGKTKLATRLYHHYGGRFRCRAFLRVSRNPDTRRLLTSLLSQIKGPRPQACCDVQDLINNVHEHLQGKSYLVIVDDLWATSVWDIISRGFPDSDCCSRIITTTQAQAIALACCSYYSNNMYEMRPFCDDQLQQLFSGNSQGMQEVLNLMYNDLPDHLKTCLLYLNTYPEDYGIPKNDLVKQWVAEGFIGAEEGKDREVLAESYFDDLVTRGMLQTVDTSYNNEVLSCTVHHIVLDLIARKSVEENFITVVEYFETVTGFAEKIRRLSLKFGGSKSVQIPGSFRLSQVRSLLFSGFLKCAPSIGKFRLLRVLILHVWADQDNKTFDLTRICELFLLRYLKILCNVTVKLPVQMQGLEWLETMEIGATILEAIPSDIVRLKHLLHLLLPCDTVMPEGIGHMISLRTLGNFDLSSNLGDSLLSLGQLTNLQNLHLTCTVLSNHVVSNMDRVASILGKITNLKCLVLDGGASSSQSISCDGLSSVSPSPGLLERIELSPRICIISSLPRWIGELSKLHTLKIALPELTSDDVDILKVLPALAALLLYVRTASAERILITKEGFSVLKYFKLICTAPCIAFAEGAMHTVRRLKLGFTADKTKQYSPVDAGFKHLTGLEVLSAKIGGADESGREAVQYSFEDAFSQHPRPPVINIQWVDSILETDNKEKQADSRITLSPGAVSRMWDPESSSHVPNPDVDRKPAIVMEAAMVCAFTGAINSIVTKLSTLLADEQYAELRGPQDDALLLKCELDATNTVLERLADTTMQSVEMKECRNQVRELTYDIEDCIDDIMLQFDRGIQATTRCSEKWAMIKIFSDKIRTYREKLEKADLVSKTQITDSGSSCYVASESRLSMVYDKGMGLVGMDDLRDQLVKRVFGGEQERQVVCILGPAGVGKTKLAVHVYNHYIHRFRKRAFVSFSKNVNIAMVLRDIFSQIELGPSSHRAMRGLIEHIQLILREERYLVVLDGVWSAQIWNDIKHALPENNYGSRIIITTSISDVTKSCSNHSSSVVYRMKPLCLTDSVSLFQSIIFGSVGSWPVGLEKVGEKIVEACGGIPLAIRVIAGVLASKPAEREEWDMVEKHMESAMADPLSAEGMRKILSISYSDLPLDMRTCLLYLSCFPDNFIRKDILIRKWVSEGFLPKSNDRSWWETGERYFFELVARKLIEPVYHFKSGGYIVLEEIDGVPIGCIVHGLVYDFITDMSSEENFVKWDISYPACKEHDLFGRHFVRLSCDSQEVNDKSETQPPLALFQKKGSSDLSRLRSLTLSGGVEGICSIWTLFKCLRVLDLEGTNGLTDDHLRSIGCMPLLRFLGLRATVVIKNLPEEIMALESLATLDVRGTWVRQLPAFRSSRLVSLLADGLEIPMEMGSIMQGLEELSTVLVGKDKFLDAVLGLVNQSKWLKMLGVKFSSQYNPPREHGEHFFEGIAKSSLRYLLFDGFHTQMLPLLLKCWTHTGPHNLRRFELKFSSSSWFPKVPTEIASLLDLTHLHMEVAYIEAEGLGALGKLPNLVLLKLSSRKDGGERCLISADGFQCFKMFCVTYISKDGAMGLQFGPGAMPQLRMLDLQLFEPSTTLSRYGDFDFGIQHLSLLTQVRITINCRGSHASEVKAAEAAIRDQVSRIPNKPLLELSRFFEEMMENSDD